MPSFFLTVRFPVLFLGDECLESLDDPQPSHEKHAHVFYETDSQIMAEQLLAIFRDGHSNEELSDIDDMIDGNSLNVSQRVKYREQIQELEVIFNLQDDDPGVWDRNSYYSRETKFLVGKYRQARKWESLIQEELEITKNPQGRVEQIKDSDAKDIKDALDKLSKLTDEEQSYFSRTLLVLFAQAYYALVEAVGTASMHYVDLELNHAYLWVVENIKKLLESPEFVNFPEGFEPVIENLLPDPNSGLDMCWEESTLPRLTDFLARTQAFLLDLNSVEIILAQNNETIKTIILFWQWQVEEAIKKARLYSKRTENAYKLMENRIVQEFKENEISKPVPQKNTVENEGNKTGITAKKYSYDTVEEQCVFLVDLANRFRKWKIPRPKAELSPSKTGVLWLTVRYAFPEINSIVLWLELNQFGEYAARLEKAFNEAVNHAKFYDSKRENPDEELEAEQELQGCLFGVAELLTALEKHLRHDLNKPKIKLITEPIYSDWEDALTTDEIKWVEGRCGALVNTLSALAELVRQVDRLATKSGDTEEAHNGISCIRFSAQKLRPFIELAIGAEQAKKFYSELVSTLRFYESDEGPHLISWCGGRGEAESLAKRLESWQRIIGIITGNKKQENTAQGNGGSGQVIGTGANGSNNVSDSVELTDTEENILEALGGETMRGKTLLQKAGYDYSSHYRQTLSHLVKRRILNKTDKGYKRVGSA